MLDNLETLKREVEALQREHDRAEGAYRQLLRRLRKEFKCHTLKEAVALLKKKEALERKAAARYSKKKKVFEEKHQDRLRRIRDGNLD